MCSVHADPVCFLVTNHLIMRIAVHTNVSSMSINGTTMLMMMMIVVDTRGGVDPGNPVLLSVGVIIPDVEV